MLAHSEKIFSVYEKPEIAEPSERVELVPEGFAFWAFLFGALWLIAKRMWLVLAGYVALSVLLQLAVEAFGARPATHLLVELALQFALGVFAHDLEGWRLCRQGYRFTGVLTGHSAIAAEQRYYEHAV